MLQWGLYSIIEWENVRQAGGMCYKILNQKQNQNTLLIPMEFMWSQLREGSNEQVKVPIINNKIYYKTTLIYKYPQYVTLTT